MGQPPLYVTFLVCPSIHPSILLSTYLSHTISQELHIIWSWFLVHLCKMMIFPCIFFIFSKFWFFVLLGGKRAKNNVKLPISVCFALYLRNCRSYHNFDNDISRCFSLFFFFFKCNIVNIKIIFNFNFALIFNF